MAGLGQQVGERPTVIAAGCCAPPACAVHPLQRQRDDPGGTPVGTPTARWKVAMLETDRRTVAGALSAAMTSMKAVIVSGDAGRACCLISARQSVKTTTSACSAFGLRA
jgi:hypothetical protein